MWNLISLAQIWTRVAVSISYDDNHYTTCTFRLKIDLVSYSDWAEGSVNMISEVEKKNFKLSFKYFFIFGFERLFKC